MAEVVTNRAVEQAAVDYVVAKERQTGRDARDVRGTGAAGDVDSPPRTTEVKAYGRSARGSDFWLEVRQVEEARRNSEFYVCEVHPRGARRAATRPAVGAGEEQRYYTVPWPVSGYDAGG